METRYMQPPETTKGWPPVPTETPARNWVAALLLAALLACILLLALHQQQVQARRQMAQAEVLVAGQVIRVDVADTPALQSRGLGGRRRLGPLRGMLFTYAEKSTHTFWMKDMVIPIDIIWLDNHRVVHIEHNVPPPSRGTPDHELTTYAPDTPANMVLELAAGRARALGLRVGSQVRFRFHLN